MASRYGGAKRSLLGPEHSTLKLRSGSHLPHSTATPLRATHPPPAQPLVGQAHGNAVRFYHAHEPYYEFTNFYPRTVRIMDKDWPSTEHFFQAQKFVGTPIEDEIRKCGSAREAFELARKPQYQAWLHPEWHKGVKDDVMMLAVKEKFTQHEDLQKKLLQTGEREIVEHTANDSYWGDGGGWGRGQNKLGKILMQVRNELKEGIQSDAQRVRFLLHRSSSTERGMERVGSHSRPRSRSVDRIQQGGTDYRYGHLSRRDGQPTSDVGGLGRRPLSRRDGPTTGVGGTGRRHSSRDGQPTSGVGDLERRRLNSRVDPATRVGGTGRGLSSRQDGPVQPTTGAVHTGMGASSRGGQATWDSTPQTSRPASSSRRSTGRGNESSQMAAILDHNRYKRPWY